ncbi:hypothetical protein ACRJ4B_38155 [Streptomyces sp. GTA36]|uniref:hypothetical protein n=1 Tax=Streptomyces sp. 2-1 TaxID=412710 RepID=UPI003AFAB0D9
MSIEAIAALAAAGGAAVVQAAGTDTWNTVKAALARLLSRGDTGTETAELEHLERTRAALTGAALADRIRLEDVWRTHLEVFLSSITDEEVRATAAHQLAAVIRTVHDAHGPVAHAGGVAAGGDISIRADHGVAGAVVNVEGGVNIASPLPPRRP